jgi:glycosyltransferase involved in cell wall biosynthesis
MRRPRLVYVVTHPVTADWLLRGQLQFMREQGFDVSVVAAPGPLMTAVAEREGVRTVDVPMTRGTNPREDAIALGRLVRFFRSLRPDIVNSSTTKGGLLGMMAARIAGVPIRVYLLRGLRLETVTGPMRTILGVTERIAAACANDVVCVSRSLMRLAVGGGHIPASKALVLGEGSSNGVDTDHFGRTAALKAEGERRVAAFGIRSSEKVIGFVGRLVFDKGVAEVLDAFERVRAAMPNARLLFLGSNLGDQNVDPELARKVRGAGVVSTGHIPDVAPYYARMDVLAFPSYREGFPNTLLEAACAELPIVAFRSTGIVDAVVDGETGTLVPKGDSAALALGILGYLNSPERAAAHAKAGRERVERLFTRRVVWHAWLDFYRRRLVEGSLPTPRPEHDKGDERLRMSDQG